MQKLIHLRDYSDVYLENKRAYNLIRIDATQSRLMGVIGIRMVFEELVLYFHCDYEEYGLDRIEVTKTVDQQTTDAVMGALGEGFVEISLNEATSLIYEAISVGNLYDYPIPLEFFEYEDVFSEEILRVDKTLLRKISVDVTEVNTLLNYFLMRTAGLDHTCRKKLLQSGDFDFEFSDEPAILIKNEIIPYGEDFICQSIVDYDNTYKMIVTRLSIKEMKVAKCHIIEELIMSPKEASFQLNKKEFIMLYYLEEPKAFTFAFEKSSMIKNEYTSGTLLTAFNKNNKHVDATTYYLNGDIYASYFITDKQLVVTCLHESHLNEIKNELNERGLELMAELEAETPILNRFVTSGYNDFFDFLGE